MSILSKHLIRYGVILGAGAAAFGCSSDGDPLPAPGSISLSLSETSATVEQGGSQTVTATLTRIGGFTGTVHLMVFGAHSGVTTTVSDVQTSGAVTTATITILAGVAVPGEYPLVVYGTGSGVGAVTQAFTLTVPVGPGFSISLSAAALSIAQGASTPTTTVNITRGINTGGVGLYVTGLPTGVTDSFDPASWPVGNSTILTLTVGAAAVPGIYNLQVTAYDAEQHGEVSAPLALTITAPPPAPGYTITLSSSTLSIVQGAAAPTTTVNVVRNNFAGPVELSIGWYGEDHDVLPPGVTAAFAPNPGMGNSAVLTITVGAAATPGVHSLFVFAEASTGWIPLTLTVLAASP